MATQTSKIHLRSITIIGAGAAVLAVIGYLIMKSDSRKKSKKKVSSKNEQTTDTVCNKKHEESSMSSFNEVNETEEINKLCDLYTKKAVNLSSSPPLSVVASSETILTKPYNKAHVGGNDEAIVPNSKQQVEISSLVNTTSNKNEQNNNNNNNSQEYCIEYILSQKTEKQILLNNLEQFNHQNFDLERNTAVEQSTTTTTDTQQQASDAQEQVRGLGEMVNDKLSETSSDSGNGTSELLQMIHSPHDYDDNCLRRSKTSPESNHSISSLGDHNTSDHIKEEENETSKQSSSMPQSISTMSISSTTTTTTQPQSDIIVYEFHFPRKYCGKLIGRNGVHVDYIRNKTHVQIAVRNDPGLDDLQIVCLTGCISDVDQALEIISARFPYRHYPQISFKPIAKIVCRRNRIENNKVLVSSNMYVQLPLKGQQFDAHVSAIVTPTHLFIQLPSHPTYERLQYLDGRMLDLYTTSDKNIPCITTPVDSGTIIAAPTSYGWHRAMITDHFTNEAPQLTYPFSVDPVDMATIKFLDYGGYLNIPVNQLKQLRTDFMTLPFQAIEVFLDGIAATEGLEEDGKNLISTLIKNTPLKAIITGYTEEGTPLIKLFSVSSGQKSFLINNELITSGYARKIVVAS